MEKKVFVLVCDWYWECDGADKEVSVYDTLEGAKSAMKEEFDNFIKTESERNPTFLDDMTIETEDDCCSVYEEGWYDTAHIAWTIYEKEVKNADKQGGKDPLFIKANALLYDEDATRDELTHILAEILEKSGKPIDLNGCDIEIDHFNGAVASYIFLMLSGGTPLVIVETENQLHYDFSSLAIFRQKEILKEVLKSYNR